MTHLPPLTIRIDAPADRVWDILGPRFARIGEWASAIPSSQPGTEPPDGDAPPDERVCSSTLPGVPEVRERLVHYDPEAMTLSYEATQGLPRFIHRATNTCTVTATTEHTCTVTSLAQVHARGALGRIGLLLARPALVHMGRRTFDDLKYLAEHGDPSPRKRRCQERAASLAPTRP
jgi:hypothetical protein